MFIELDPQGNEIIVQPTQTGTRSAVGSGNRRGDDRRTLLFTRDPVCRHFHFFLIEWNDMIFKIFVIPA